MEANVLTKLLVAVSGQDVTLYPVHYALDLAVASDEPVDVLIVQEVAANPELVLARGQALGRSAARTARAAWEASRQTEHRIHKLANLLVVVGVDIHPQLLRAARAGVVDPQLPSGSASELAPRILEQTEQSVVTGENRSPCASPMVTVTRIRLDPVEHINQSDLL
jgi:hypothetical protein